MDEAKRLVKHLFSLALAALVAVLVWLLPLILFGDYSTGEYDPYLPPRWFEGWLCLGGPVAAILMGVLTLATVLRWSSLKTFVKGYPPQRVRATVVLCVLAPILVWFLPTILFSPSRDAHKWGVCFALFAVFLLWFLAGILIHVKVGAPTRSGRIGMDLQGKNLRNADLVGADLENGNLKKANLMDANMAGANLKNASLARANPMNANLGRADLTGALMHKADLEGANLQGVNLKNVNLQSQYWPWQIVLGAPCGHSCGFSAGGSAVPPFTKTLLLMKRFRTSGRARISVGQT